MSPTSAPSSARGGRQPYRNKKHRSHDSINHQRHTSRFRENSQLFRRSSSRVSSTNHRTTGSSSRGAAAAAEDIRDVIPVGLSFGNFDFQDMKNIGQRGGGMRELATLLRQARRKATQSNAQLRTREGIQQRNVDLLSTALQRASGKKVKDDAAKLSKAMAKRRSKKRQSAKKWAKRLKTLEDSVENVVRDRSISKQTQRARREAKAKEKDKRKAAMKAPRTNTGKRNGGGAAGKAKGRGGGKGGKDKR